MVLDEIFHATEGVLIFSRTTLIIFNIDILVNLDMANTQVHWKTIILGEYNLG